jgi:serine acetyltransferase
MSWKDMAQYFLFQRILRINSEVSWPVHWSSIVIEPKKIKMASDLRPPGLLGGTYVQAINGLHIGKNVWLGPGVKILTANHDVSDYFAHPKCGPVEIGDDCWLGANSVVLPEVKLGHHVIVAAGAVVTKSFPSDVVVGGVPAQILRRLEPYTGQRAEDDFGDQG